jgi:CubicO group peptidase (beta-lactamase class C family)
MTSLLPLALASALAAHAAAAPPLSLDGLEPEVAALVRPLVQGKKGVGVVVGVLDRGERRVFGYGGVAVRGGLPPDGDTLFEIGSITKPFTAVLLADLAREGKVKLDDPLQKHLPPGLVVPKRGDKPITLQHLATHHSGLPVEPALLIHVLTRGDWANPYSRYGVKSLASYLPRCELRRDPGSAYGYSNLGAGLLGIALVHRAGAKSYEDLVVRRVCGPLRLDDTRITLSAGQRKRFAQGHDSRGNPTSTWDFASLEGCGALRSSAKDLLRFASANLGLPRTALGPAFEECHKARCDAGKSVRVGLAWHLVPLPGVHGPVICHDGETGGFRCFLGFNKERGTAVVVLSNSSQLGAGISRVGLATLKRLSARPGPLPKAR